MHHYNRIQDSMLPEFKRAALKWLSRHRLKGREGWLLAPIAVVALWLWNGKLLAATTIGVLVMLGVYLIQARDWHLLRAKLRGLLGGSNRHLILAVGSGGFATISTYMAISIWVDSENHWLATGAILQGLSTIAVLVLVIWQIFNRQVSRDRDNFNSLVALLTDADALKRLIAVRQLTRLVTGDRAESSECRATLEYFRLMLSREGEPLIRDALLDGIQALDTLPGLVSGAQPLSIPVAKKRATAKARQPISS